MFLENQGIRSCNTRFGNCRTLDRNVKAPLLFKMMKRDSRRKKNLKEIFL
jgi:hypothetical protein